MGIGAPAFLILRSFRNLFATFLSLASKTAVLLTLPRVKSMPRLRATCFLLPCRHGAIAQSSSPASLSELKNATLESARGSSASLKAFFTAS